MALDIPVLIFLDMSIYSGRLYIAADNGLYELDISWQDSGSISLGKVKKKIDGKCYSISAKYGAVSASCGEDGLYIFLNDLGWWKQGSSSKLVTLDRMSLRSSWLDSYLVNYRTHEQPYLFQSHLERFEYKSEGEGRVITSINQQSLDLSYFLSHAIDEAGIEERSIQYVYNFERRFFVRTRANNFFSLNIIPSSQGEVSIRDIKKYTTPVERVLSVSNGKLGPIIETFDRVLFISEERGETYPITEVGAIAVKTFPRSRRFQNMVVVTTEDGIFLVGLFDDSELHQ